MTAIPGNIAATHRAEAPSIPPVAGQAARPTVSVMLPTYQPGRYLIDALRSVMQQDLGPAEMQIAVVDDASPTVDVAALVAEAAPGGRVEVHRMASNRGLAGNWNQCVRMARGGIVHVLHQDDLVRDGFYRRLLPAFSTSPDVGMAFCRLQFIDENDRVTGRTHRERWRAGILRDWLTKIAEWQRIQCASVLVRRSVYEDLGGYRDDLCFALDWEMWVRVAARHATWYEPQMLACYRRHSGSETSRLRNAGRVGRDILETIDTFANHLPAQDRQRHVQRAYHRFARKTLKQVARLEPGASIDIDDLLQPIRIAISRLPHDRRTRHYDQQCAEIERRWRSSESR